MVGIGGSSSLEKLKIFAYETPERTDFPKTYEVMFNPESYSFTYSHSYNSNRCPSSSETQADYVGTDPRELKLKLIIDDSSATAGYFSGMPALFRPSGDTVPQQVENFLNLTTRLYGDNTGSRYLLLTWGEMSFECRVQSTQVNYTLFNRRGVALRAELNVTFLEDVKQHTVGEAVSSAATNVRSLLDGFSLPLMAAIIYQEATYYVRVAKANKLNSVRSVKKGTRLIFPPVV